MGFDMFNVDFKAHRWALFFCSITAIGALVYGYDNTYYSGILAMQEFKNDYGDHYEDGQKALATSFSSLTTSSIYIGDLLGALFAAPINERWGRKAVLFIASVFVLGGGLAQVADTHYEGVIVLGRILIGVGVGQFTVTSLMYIGEVAPVQIRGPALMMYQFVQSCSQLVASGMTQGTESIKSSLSYKLPMGGLVILPLIMVIGLPFIPESPVWYVSKGRTEDATKALRKIHKNDSTYDPSHDLIMLEEARRYEEEQAASSSWKSLLVDPVERTKVIWSAGAMYAQQICGILFFYNYAVIFAQAIGISDPYIISLVINILQVFSVGASVLTGNKLRRRTNLFVTTGIMFVAFIIIGGIGTRSLNTASQYILVIFSLAVTSSYNFGLGPITYTVAREMAVGKNENKIMSTSIVVFYFTAWLMSFTAPYLYYTANLGPMVGFVYAGTTVTSLIWVYFCVGETTGKTATEISMLFAARIPARKWRTYELSAGEVVTEKATSHVEHVDSV